MPTKATFAKLLLIAIAGGFLFGHFLIHQFSIPAETALRLSEGTLIADGVQPYTGFVDNATPYYLYLNSLPVFLSRCIYMHPIALANLMTAAFFVLTGCLTVLAASPGSDNKNDSSGRLSNFRNLSEPTIWTFVFVFVAITLLQPMHFAQANQIFFMAFCPYLICRASRLRGVKLPVNLAVSCALVFCYAAMIDALYWLYYLAFELCCLLTFFPFKNRSYISKRYLGVELKAITVVFVLAQLIWIVLPAKSVREYFNSIMKINWWSFQESLRALNFFDSAADSRPLIFLAVLFLVLALSQARQNILVRICAIASLLGLNLLIIQGATLSYQTYLFVGFAALTFAVALVHHPLLRQLRQSKLLPGQVFLPLSGGLQACYQAIKYQSRYAILFLALILGASGCGVYLIEYSLLKKAYRFDLTMLRYYGIADKRDLGIFSETVEEFSRVDDDVAILGVGVRPGYPIITQLRRRPGLSLTWGFPIDTLHMLEDPYHAKMGLPLNDFKKRLYGRMRQQLSSDWDFPILLLVDGDEIRRVLKEQEVYPAIEKNYDFLGGVSLLDVGDKDAHPKTEYVGYKSGFAIYRHK